MLRGKHMADRLDFFFRQRVTEAELDLAFALTELADRNLAADLGIRGVIAGAEPAPHEPVPNLSVDLTAPGRAYDQAGQRVFFGTGQTVDCGVDWQGLPTAVASATNERWVGIFLRFDRQLSDPRTDGNSQQVYFRRDESFQLLVRQAAEGPLGTAQRVALEPDEILLCDVRLRAGQTQIVATDIDVSRRQAFVYARATAISVDPSFWSVLVPPLPNVQAALSAADDVLLEHLTGIRRHAAADVDVVPSGFVEGSTVQEVLTDLVSKLTATTTGAAGAARIGADGVPGAPWALPPGSVDSQMTGLLGALNQHGGAATGAHPATAIVASPHNHLTSTTVQGQLQEMVADLRLATAGTSGAALVGVEPVSGTPLALPAGTVASAVSALVAALNAHITRALGAHAASSISVADAANWLQATQVEAGLAEVIEAVMAGHFRANEVNAGQHRTIRQPPLGGAKALLWDSAASGASATRFRVYADSATVWFTINAQWATDAWSKDAPAARSTAFLLSTTGGQVLHAAPSAAPFSTWSQSWRLLMADSSGFFEVAGNTTQLGRLGVVLQNSMASSQPVSTGGVVMFRHRMATAPSSVTLVPSDVVGFDGVPAIYAVDGDGFAYEATQVLPFGTVARWNGLYTTA